MLYEFKGEIDATFSFWSSSTGELNNDGGYYSLPNELQYAYDNLWNDNCWANCYIAEFDGKYGIYIEAEYDEDYASDLDISYSELVSIANCKAKECSNKYSEYVIFFGEDAIHWSDDTYTTIVSIFMPWDIDTAVFTDVVNWFDSMCYDI